MRFRAILLLQWKYLARNAAPQISLGIAALFSVLILNLPQGARARTAAAMAIADPCIVGLLFIGALILLEKSQGIGKALGVMPAGIQRLDAARLSIFAVVAALASAGLLLAGGISLPRILAFLPWIIAGSATWTLIGAAIASMVKRLNQFMMTAALCMVPSMIGLMAIIDTGGAWGLVSPSYPQALAAGALFWPNETAPFPAIAMHPLARGEAAIALAALLSAAWLGLALLLRLSAARAMQRREAA